MSNAEMVNYLNTLSDKIASMYNLTKECSDNIVQQSPMRTLLRENTDYVLHMPMKGWAKLVYENFA